MQERLPAPGWGELEPFLTLVRVKNLIPIIIHLKRKVADLPKQVLCVKFAHESFEACVASSNESLLYKVHVF